jgi:hypothetical protein
MVTGSGEAVAVHVRVRPLALHEGTTPAARVTDDSRHVVLLRRLAPHHEIDTSPSRGRRGVTPQLGSNENASSAVDATRLSFTRSVTGGASPGPRLAPLHPNTPGRPAPHFFAAPSLSGIFGGGFLHGGTLQDERSSTQARADTAPKARCVRSSTISVCVDHARRSNSAAAAAARSFNRSTQFTTTQKECDA